MDRPEQRPAEHNTHTQQREVRTGEYNSASCRRGETLQGEAGRTVRTWQGEVQEALFEIFASGEFQEVACLSEEVLDNHAKRVWGDWTGNTGYFEVRVKPV